MDVELTVLAIAGAAVLSGAVGVLVGRGTLDEGVPYTAPMGLTYTVDSGHVHQAVNVDDAGWSCACGLHYHRFVNGACACGDEGEVDTWPTT